MTDQVHDGGLHHRVGEHGGDRFGKALQAVDDSDQDVADAAVLQLVHNPQPELGALRLLDPDAQKIAFVPSARMPSAM